MKTSLPARAALLGSLSLLLAACTSTFDVSMQAVRNADYGPYPKNYQQLIRQRLDGTLLDARSAQIRFTTPPRKVYQLSREPYKLNGRAYYAVCVEVNAKNAYGGYTGWQTHRYRFVNGEIEDEAPLGSFGTDFAVCRSQDEVFISINNIGNVKVNIVP